MLSAVASFSYCSLFQYSIFTGHRCGLARVDNGFVLSDLNCNIFLSWRRKLLQRCKVEKDYLLKKNTSKNILLRRVVLTKNLYLNILMQGRRARLVRVGGGRLRAGLGVWGTSGLHWATHFMQIFWNIYSACPSCCRLFLQLLFSRCAAWTTVWQSSAATWQENPGSGTRRTIAAPGHQTLFPGSEMALIWDYPAINK